MLVQNLYETFSGKAKEFEKDFWNSNKHRATLDALKAGKLTDEIVGCNPAKEISAKYTNMSEK
jgi:F-type H+-transporting ATPase subunit alpha